MANTFHLPADGYDGPVPAFPLKDLTEDELTLWQELWTLPHAHAWAAQRYVRVVARSCRTLVECEEAGARITRLIEARQLEDRLGLSPMSLLRLRWQIDSAGTATVTPIAEKPRRRLSVAEENDDEQ